MTLTLTTAVAHGYTVPGNVVVSGIGLQGAGANPFNGVFAIESVSDNQIIIKVPIDVDQSPVWTRNARIGDAVPSKGIEVTSIAHVAGGEDFLYELETAVPHNRSANNRLKLGGVWVFYPAPISEARSSVSFNGTSFKIEKIVSPTKLQFLIVNGADSSYDIIYYNHPIFIDNPSIALSADAGAAAVVEGNRVFSCEVGGPYHDTFSSGDLTVRDNFYWDVTNSVMQNMSEQSTDPEFNHYLRAGIRLEAGGEEGKIATFWTDYDHGLQVGDAVRVVTPNDPFYGHFKVKNLGTSGSEFYFTYTMASPGGPTQAGKFHRFWQVNWLNIERNLIECGPPKHTTGFGGPFGFLNGGPAFPSNSIYTFKMVAALENFISKSDIRALRPMGWDWRYWGYDHYRPGIEGGELVLIQCAWAWN